MGVSVARFGGCAARLGGGDFRCGQVDFRFGAGSRFGRSLSGTRFLAASGGLDAAAGGGVQGTGRSCGRRRMLGDRRQLQSRAGSRVGPRGHRDLDRPTPADGDAADRLAHRLRRVGGRIELWNGNRERWRNFFSLDKEESVIVWAWQTYAANRARYEEAMADPAHGHLRFVRLRSPAAVRHFLREAEHPPAYRGGSGFRGRSGQP